MAQRAEPLPYMTVEEYLAFEETSQVRHEYVDGTLYAFAGTTHRHSRIVLNITRAIADRVYGADDSPCDVYASDMRCLIGKVYYYPDVMVCCEPVETDRVHHRDDPCLLIEVLSSSTALTDRREKLLIYRSIPTLRAYLIVDQDTRRIERHHLDADGDWQRTDHLNDGVVPIPCPVTELAMDDIYRGVRFP